MTKLKLLTLIVLLFTLTTVFAQDNLVSRFEKVRDVEDLTLKLSFHSWGEDRTTEINLDTYFPIKRDPNSRYIFLAPPEISVRIDQTKGTAYLQAFEQWIGTKDIIFTLTDIYRLEAATSSLQAYRTLITQQRAPLKIKREFKDLPPYHLFEKILDHLENQKTPTPEVKVVKRGENVKIDIAEELNIELDIQTLTEDKIPTLKPTIDISIQPEKVSEEAELTSGTSLFIFIPLILIALTLVIIAGFYLRNNLDKLKERFKKKEPKEKSKINKLVECTRKLSEIENKIGKDPLEKSTSNLFAVIKRFFNLITPAEYQFSYSEIKEKQLDPELSDHLKEKLCDFSRNIADIRFSGDKVEKGELKKILSNSKKLIHASTREERGVAAEKEKARISKTFPISTIKYILESFTTKEKTQRQVSTVKERFDLRKSTKNLFHKLGLLQTLAEKELTRKRKYKLQLTRLRDKQKAIETRKHQKELAIKRRKDEKRRKKLLKLREKQAKEKLKVLEEHRRLRETQKRKDEKLKHKKAQARAIRQYFHDKFGLFKTVKDLEKRLEAKRKEKVEKERFKRTKKRKRKQAFLNFLHFLRLYKTPEEKHQAGLILKKEERLEKQRQDRKRQDRKEKFLDVLHSFKLYRTPQEVQKEKDRRLKKLREKERSKEEKYHLEQLERRKKLQTKERIKLKKLAEKHIKQQQKALAKRHRQQRLDDLQKSTKKFFHDRLGLFKNPTEIQKEREEKLYKAEQKRKEKQLKKIEKLKQRERERIEKEKEAKIKFQEKQRKQALEKIEKAKKHRAQTIKNKLKKEKALERKKKIRKFLHDKLGLLKSPSEKENERELAKKKKHLKKIERAKKSHTRSLKEKQLIRNFRKFLHNHFGLYKTEKDLEKQKHKIKLELKEKQEKKKLKELESRQRKLKFRRFLHDRLGLFKTREEILLHKKQRREHRIELEQKLENTVLKALASRLQRKKLTPEQEIKILMQLEEVALKRKDTKKAELIQKKINKLYKKVRKQKSSKLPLLANRISNTLEETRDYLFSKTSKLEPISPFFKKLSRLTTSFAPKLEKTKLDQIKYLIDKSEIELKRKKRDEAKDYYQRALHLYKSLNKASKRVALPDLLKIKNEITSLALTSSLEKAFGAMYLGQVKKAENLYKNIDINFHNLPQKEKEKIHDQKTELYQKLTEKPSPNTFTKIKNNFLKNLKVIKSKFSKKPKKTFPLNERRFQPPSTPQKQAPNVKKLPEKTFQKKESLQGYLLAKKPHFTSIKTETTNVKYIRNLTGKLLNHIKKAESHLEKQNHEKAHENYHMAAQLFKDLKLKPQLRDSIYNNLEKLKHSILQTSLHNYISKTKKALTKGEVKDARKHHELFGNIYGHLRQKSPTKYNSLTLEEDINNAFNLLKKDKIEEASKIYQKINTQYNNLTPEEKKIIYTKLITLYSEILKKSKK
tara:strand:- start:4742 stop:9058 length:4317 start_codon:yes stop_codon:yes gene_type:complete